MKQSKKGSVRMVVSDSIFDLKPSVSSISVTLVKSPVNLHNRFSIEATLLGLGLARRSGRSIVCKLGRTVTLSTKSDGYKGLRARIGMVNRAAALLEMRITFDDGEELVVGGHNSVAKAIEKVIDYLVE